MGNPWAITFETHLLFIKATGATSQNSRALTTRTKIGQVESRSREAKETVTNATCQSWGANAPPSPSDDETRSGPYVQAGTPGNAQRPEKLALCGSRDFSSERGKKAKFDFGGPQAADSFGIHENEHQRRRETLTHSVPSEENYDEMIIRLRLFAERDAPETSVPGGTKLSNYAAAREVDATTLLETIARRTRFAELFSAATQSTNEAVIPRAESREDASSKGMTRPAKSWEKAKRKVQRRGTW